jgi:hypothetical protein
MEYVIFVLETVKNKIKHDVWALIWGEEAIDWYYTNVLFNLIIAIKLGSKSNEFLSGSQREEWDVVLYVQGSYPEINLIDSTELLN